MIAIPMGGAGSRLLLPETPEEKERLKAEVTGVWTGPVTIQLWPHPYVGPAPKKRIEIK